MSNQNPARQSRQAYLALLAIVIGSVVAFVTLPITTVASLAPFALVGAISFFAAGSIYFEEARKRSRMERGEGVVARWTLDALLWQDFVRLNEGKIVLPRLPVERIQSSSLCVEVVFAEDAVYVDGDYYTMDRHWGTNATLEPSTPGPSYIELGQGGLEDYTPIRIPIPAGHQDDAERVAHYFNAPIG